LTRSRTNAFSHSSSFPFFFSFLFYIISSFAHIKTLNPKP